MADIVVMVIAFCGTLVCKVNFFELYTLMMISVNTIKYLGEKLW